MLAECPQFHVCYKYGRNVRKSSLWHVYPKNTQISLHIRAVWSEYSLFARRNFALWLSKMLSVKILIRLLECTGWSESSLGGHVRKYISDVAVHVLVIKLALFIFSKLFILLVLFIFLSISDKKCLVLSLYLSCKAFRNAELALGCIAVKIPLIFGKYCQLYRKFYGRLWIISSIGCWYLLFTVIITHGRAA